VVGYDQATDAHFTIPFDEVDAYFPGTGDIFSSVLMGRVLSGRSLRDATANAMGVVLAIFIAVLSALQFRFAREK